MGSVGLRMLTKLGAEQMARVLVIEDDVQVGDLLRQVLERMGHEVSHATDGEEGVHQFVEAQFDLIITDILMPRKGGVEVIKDLIRIEPEVKIIAISGGSRNLKPEECLRTPHFLVECTLQKPFSRSEIEAAVDKLVERPGAEAGPPENSKPHRPWLDPHEPDMPNP